MSYILIVLSNGFKIARVEDKDLEQKMLGYIFDAISKNLPIRFSQNKEGTEVLNGRFITHAKVFENKDDLSVYLQACLNVRIKDEEDYPFGDPDAWKRGYDG